MHGLWVWVPSSIPVRGSLSRCNDESQRGVSSPLSSVTGELHAYPRIEFGSLAPSFARPVCGRL